MKLVRRIVGIVVALYVLNVGVSLIYSGENRSGMLTGDGYLHSIIAQEITDTRSVLDANPIMMFDAERMHPLHYTQIYHLGLAGFNQMIGAETFDKTYTLLIYLLAIRGSCLVLNQFLPRPRHLYGWAVGSVIFITVVGDRFFRANFLEPYMLVIFLGVLISIFKTSKHLSRYVLFGLLVGLLGVTKHLGMFMVVAVGGVLTIRGMVYNRRILISSVVALCVMLPPLAYQFTNVGSIGFGVGTLDLPDAIPGSQRLEENLFSSHFDYPYSESEVAKFRLSYLKSRPPRTHLGLISTHRFESHASIDRIDRLRITITLIGALTMRHSLSFGKQSERTLSVILLACVGSVVVVSLAILLLRQQRLEQYYILFQLVLVIWFVVGLRQGVLRHCSDPMRYLVTVLIVVTSLVGFYRFEVPTIRNDVGRRTLAYENLFEQLAARDDLQQLQTGTVHTSNPMYGYYADAPYLWDQIIYTTTDNFATYVDYYDISTLIIAAYNYENSGFYDYVPEQMIIALQEQGAIAPYALLEEDDARIEVYTVVK